VRETSARQGKPGNRRIGPADTARAEDPGRAVRPRRGIK